MFSDASWATAASTAAFLAASARAQAPVPVACAATTAASAP